MMASKKKKMDEMKEQRLYCVCRQPNDKSKMMIQCDCCKEWFHTRCMSIDDDEVDQLAQWHCTHCVDLMSQNPEMSNKRRMDGELLALQWMEHSRIFSQAIGSLRGKAAYTDATLACEGRFFQVHKFVLSTCSEYFNDIFEWTPCVNPVVVLNNVSCKELEALLDFMYIGEVNVRETQIPDIMHGCRVYED